MLVHMHHVTTILEFCTVNIHSVTSTDNAFMYSHEKEEIWKQGCHVNVIHMHIIAFCIHFPIIACCPYLTCSSVCNYSHILCVLVTQCFVLVCVKHHLCIWLGISLFDSKHLYNNVLLLTCSVSYFVFICRFMER